MNWIKNSLAKRLTKKTGSLRLSLSYHTNKKMDMGFTIKDIQAGLAKGHFTSEKIKKENKKLNAYLSLFENGQKGHYSASRGCCKLETENSTAMPLWGVPCAIKDNMLIEGTIATAGSKILENYISSYDSTVIKKLKKEGVS